MNATVTSLTLALLALLSLAASAVSLRRLFRPARSGETAPLLGALVAVVTGGALAVYVARWTLGGQWQPIESHVDGLLLIAALLGATVLFILSRRRLLGLSAFALPVLTVVLAWAVCAAKWTYRPFDLQTLHPVWMAVHLTGVYLGTVSAGVAAVAGAMYLYVQSRLKHKSDLPAMGHLASLETLEKLIVRAATLGFALLTLGLISGGVISLDERGVVAGWFAVKVAVALLAWAVYALLINVRYSAAFRGRRAAWLSIAAFLLLFVVYGVVVSLPTAAHAAATAGGGP